MAENCPPKRLAVPQNARSPEWNGSGCDSSLGVCRGHGGKAWESAMTTTYCCHSCDAANLWCRRLGFRTHGPGRSPESALSGRSWGFWYYCYLWCRRLGSEPPAPGRSAESALFGALLGVLQVHTPRSGNSARMAAPGGMHLQNPWQVEPPRAR